MISAPSCYLQVSFLLHGVGFLLLLIGYSTPYWTLVMESTGNIYCLGLVVSCFETGCKMLNVTEARDVVVIVFGMSTGNIMMALFITQLFCLSLCNDSFRSKNMGLGLSYLSFLIALSGCVTQALYQIDLREEDTSDVTSMTIGWSRYTVIFSSVAFFLGALLSIADYLRRNLVHQVGLGKKWAIRNTVIEMTATNKEAQDDVQTVDGSFDQNMTEVTNADNSQSNQMPESVTFSKKTAIAKQGLKKSMNACSNIFRNHGPKTNVTLVSEIASGSKESRAAGGSCHQQQTRQTTPSHGREGLAIVADALKKYNVTKVRNADVVDGRYCLPSVEEEKSSYDTSHQKQNKPVLMRQAAVADDSGSLCETSEKLPVVNTENSRHIPDSMSNIKTTQVPCDLSKKHVFVRSDTPIDHTPKLTNEKETGKTDHSKNTTGKMSQNQGSRRNSAVENALLSVSQLLDRTVPEGHSSAEQKFDTSKHRQILQTGVDYHKRPPEKVPRSTSVERWRKMINEKVGTNGKGHLTVDESTCQSAKTGNTNHRRNSKQDQNKLSGENETVRGSNMATVSGKDNTNPRRSQFQEQISQDQIKRNIIIENLSRDLQKRKHRISQ